MAPIQIPNFTTLDQTPSWCNSRGGLDRSACVEVRVSEVRRLAGCVIKDGQRRRDGKGLTQLVTPLPGEKKARNRHGRVATGIYTITAAEVDELHRTREPRRLAGDFRTARANAMRVEPSAISDEPSATSTNRQSSIVNRKSRRRLRTRVTRANPIAWPPDRNLDGNPNKGASRSKMIGLPEEWSQPLRIEKWIFPDRIRPAYYLICPGGFHHRGTENTEKEALSYGLLRVGNKTPSPFSRERARVRVENSDHLAPCMHGAICDDPRLPPLSTVARGRNAARGGCTQRSLKLLMIQCTRGEFADAMTAQLWIRSLPPRLVPKYRPLINRLVARYGLLFQPRVLMCARCLGVKYGNHPETVRQGWRRRNNKPDTTVATNVLDAPVEFTHWSRYNYAFAWEAIHGVPWGRDPEEYRASKEALRKARRREYLRQYRKKRKRDKADSPQRRRPTVPSGGRREKLKIER